MTLTIQVVERGAGKGFKRFFAKASKRAWLTAGLFDDDKHALTPFTEEFRVKAGFPARRGQNMPRNTAGFLNSYYGRKLRSPSLGGGKGLALPNVYSGRSREKMAYNQTTATAKGVTNKYSAPALRFKNARSRVHPMKEVETRLPKQQEATVAVYDKELEKRLIADKTEFKQIIRG